MQGATVAAMGMRGQLVFRVPASLERRIDAYVAKLAEQTGLEPTRAMVTRKLLTDALDAAGIEDPGEPADGKGAKP